MRLLTTVAALLFTQPALAQVPATQPTTQSARPALLEEVAQAYDGLQTLKLSGTFRGDFQAAGRSSQETLEFSSVFSAADGFRHEVPEQQTMVGGSDGIFVFIVPQNTVFQGAAYTGTLESLPHTIRSGIEQTNSSMALAMTGDALQWLMEGVSEVSVGEPLEIDGQSYPTLVMQMDGPTVVLAVDDATKLVRRATFDMTAVLEAQDVPDVKRAEMVIDYATTEIDTDIPAEVFTFIKPDHAMVRELPRHPEALVGQSAPTFELETLQGETKSLAELSGGDVVVVSFWATWCPPCVESMPSMNVLSQKEGVTVLAINVRETNELARAFMESHNLTLPVLMDRDGKVADMYAVQGIPQAVIIGRNGTITEVVIGLNNSAVEAAVSKALASDK